MDTPAGAAQHAHEYLLGTSLIGNVLEAAGEYDAKTEPDETTSLAAHLLNAMTIGVNTFVYTAVDGGRDIMELEEELKVLAAALVLHDTNKYVREAHGVDTDGNTRDAFETYFEHGDDFGIEEFLGEGYRDDLLYLVQRTELTEDSRETRGINTEFVGLDRYCRLGDQVASVILRDGVEGGYETLVKKVDDDEIHLVELNSVEQPILHNEVLGATKEVISGEDGGEEYGVVIGSTPNHILYLGDTFERKNLEKRVYNQTKEKIINQDRYNFSCKLGWNTFDYDVLGELSLPIEEKIDQIRKQAIELLKSDSGGIEPLERVPEEFSEYLPALIKAIYVDGDSEFEPEKLQQEYDSVYDSIEGGKSTKGQKIKLRFITELAKDHGDFSTELEQIQQKYEPHLREDLETSVDAIKEVVQSCFNINEITTLPNKAKMCFLCGGQTEVPYQKGQTAVYRPYEFSKRVPPHEQYKSICEVCNLEYELLANRCERAGVSLNASVGVAYYYFDAFLGDIHLFGGKTIGFEQDETLDLGETDVQKNLTSPQYYIQPFRFGSHPRMGEKNHRMVVVRQLMQRAQDVGMKVVLGRPFTRFDATEKAFVDEDAIREQELLGLDEAERFGPLPSFVDRDEDKPESHLRRALALHKLIATVGFESGMSNPYLQLDRDTFHSLTDFVVQNHDNATRLQELESYLDTYHHHQLMNMKTVAERGIDLFGKQFDSKYKKTKIFREAIDAFLSGKNQRMSEDELLEYVEAQVYTVAEREDYAGYATPDQAKAFVEAVRSYLVENDLYTLKKLSDWENALVNSYLYAYEQVLYEDTEDTETEETLAN
jgi:CRISPR-associated protein Csc3